MQRGAWITDTIQLSAPIAEGAMGRVWVGYHHRLQIEVAIKFVSEKLGDDTAEAVARFEREASTASQIKSLHVVQTFDSGVTHQGVPYIVMELLEGESLGERLRRAGRLDPREAITVITHCGRALQKAHDLGIVHRDIKPDNIFMCHSEEGILCKILDFGIAKQTQLPAMGGLTTDGKIVGTPEYMSPEQVLEDRPVDYRADLWALAVVMYQAITGDLPFNGMTLGQLCLNLVGRDPVKPSRYRPDLPKRVDAWFSRALCRDPQHRFDSAQQMAEAFARLEEDVAFGYVEDTTERHLSSTATLKRIAPPATRSKGGMIVTVLGVAAAIVALGGGSWLVAQPAEPVMSAHGDLTPPVVQAVANVKESPVDETPAAVISPGPPPTAILDLDTEPPGASSPMSPSAMPAMRRAPPSAEPVASASTPRSVPEPQGKRSPSAIGF